MTQTKQGGVGIKDFSTYRIYEDGTVRNIHNRALKPDKKGCVSVIESNRRKTLSIARLVAISFLGMPDDVLYRAYKKDPNGSLDISNITWDSVANLNKERLTKSRENKTVITQDHIQELLQDHIQRLKQELLQDHIQQLKQELLQDHIQQLKQELLQEMEQKMKQQQQKLLQQLKQEMKEMMLDVKYDDDDEYDECDVSVW